MGQRVRQAVSDHGKLSPIPSSDTCKIPALEQGPCKEHRLEDRRKQSLPLSGPVSTSAKWVEWSPTFKWCCKADVVVGGEALVTVQWPGTGAKLITCSATCPSAHEYCAREEADPDTITSNVFWTRMKRTPGSAYTSLITGRRLLLFPPISLKFNCHRTINSPSGP